MVIGLTLFAVFIILLFAGLPVSYSMALSTLVALLMGDYSTEVLSLTVVEGVQSYILLAVPFFILAGNLMNATGITQRIFDFSAALCNTSGFKYESVCCASELTG